MATYKIESNSNVEGFTEADNESLEFAPEDIESLESESMQSVSLEDVKPQTLIRREL